MPTSIFCREYERLAEHRFFADRLPATGGFVLSPEEVAAPSWMPRVHLADPHVGPRGDTLVCIFLRGGADGLNLVVPHGDEAYYARRPTLAIPRPDDRGAGARAIDLDGFFGLHPALTSFQALYTAGHLALIQAVGAPDESRSHFAAQALMERGVAPEGYTGWLARHLLTLDTDNDSPLRAVSLGDLLPLSLLGPVNAAVLPSIERERLRAEPGYRAAYVQTLQALYAQEADELLAASARQTLEMVRLLRQVEAKTYRPRGRAYPAHPFGQALSAVARLIQADVGVEVACIDLGGWDTHAAQGGVEGIMARQLTLLAEGLAAFYEDILPQVDSVTLVALSEFGRRVEENGSGGTDHGHGNAMLLLGGQVRGGRVVTQWPGLAPEQLVGPGDLAITIDYRDVLGEVVRQRLNNPQLEVVFPGYAVVERGVVRAR